LQNTHSHFSEGIRTARTGVMLSGLDSPSKILLITSSVPGEGKTTVSVNLAFAHAQSNTRTLLIDCDMRRSQASRMVGLGAAKLGLTTLVAGRATAEECIHQVKNTGLFMLPVGETPPNPLELLLTQKFKDTLAELSKEYPMIIIDSPPVELVSEALVLAPLVTNVAVVVRAMSTPAPLVRKTQLRLQRAGGQLLGVIINGLNFKEARAYYGEYAHSSYSYAYDAAGGNKIAGKGNVLQMLKGKMPWSRSKAASPESGFDKAA
jgi:capsular exopolysaccharide synthesis family protein